MSTLGHYIDGGAAQVHLRACGLSGEQPPLLCLHPAPYSGLFFTTAMPLIAADRMVIAPDYPGYGGSTAPDAPPSIADYAQAMLDVIDALDSEVVDVLGFHTGCLVGAELSLLRPAAVNRLLLIDVPYFDANERAGLLETAAAPRKLTPELASLETDWAFSITGRLDTMPYERAFALLAESLRAGDRSHWGFRAAFSYPCEERFAALAAETIMIATDSGLREPTRRAAAALPAARLAEVDIERAVFEENAPVIAAASHAALP